MPTHAALQTRTLFISAGHSDSDPGAVGHGYTEANIVLDFRDRLANYLRERVIFDKDGAPGQNLPLNDAVGAAKSHELAVEFHCNAGGPGATGVETLSRPHHYPLGEQICDAIAGALGIPSRGARPEDHGPHSRLAFVSGGGGIIVELFFISNKSDIAKYLANKRQCVEAVGAVLVDAICADGYDTSEAA